MVGVAEVWGYYRERIQPKARTYNPRKIAARLKTFTVDELKQGIDHFAADHWWMEQNASRGADWFFDKDARSEQFLNMTPRQLVASGNGHAKNGQVGKQSRSDEDKLIAYARRLGQEV